MWVEQRAQPMKLKLLEDDGPYTGGDERCGDWCQKLLLLLAPYPVLGPFVMHATHLITNTTTVVLSKHR